MKKYALAVLCVFLCAVIYAQEFGSIFDGRSEDIRSLPRQDRQKEEFTFVRLIYNGRIPGYLKNWYTDYPSGDKNLTEIIRRLTKIQIAAENRAIPIMHPDLFNYPLVYSCEAGQMVLSWEEAFRLREYLSRGGFWMIDDFWGSFEWQNFEKEINKVFSGKKIVDIPLSHPIFHAFYDIDEIMQVPNIGYAYSPGTPTWEQDGYEPHARGIFDDKGRLMVMVNYNTDLMDASEWADDRQYPQEFSAYAYKIFTNAVIYTMTH